MEYLALYRKYRPSEFDSLVGQSEIKKILSNSIKNSTITHAYLFSGPRGTGKTTTAKILSKMVNCESPIDGNPCNKCNSCLNIFNSSDIIEIDAASNNGVDEIRDLREKANLVPSICKYKVYIIDEVHMLTTQAFNALLKTLEEPPKHVIFILATTEYYKIPLTITSRCQKFQFNKLENEDIVTRLREISDLENIEIDDDALYEIAKISDGGMRDSINFLDQIRSFTSNRITIGDVYDVCGNISIQEISDLFVNIKNQDVEKVTLFFENMNSMGKNYNKFFEDIISFLKDLVIYRKNVSTKLIRSDVVYLDKICKLYEDNEIYYVIEFLNGLMDRLKNVSRQSVVVVCNFLLMMYKLNNNMENVVIKNDKKEKSEEYEMAFSFTSNSENEVSKLTVNELDIDNSLSDNENLVVSKNKEIIINNAFSLADKKIKSNLQDKYTKISDYLTDKQYLSAASLLVDTKIEVAGDGYVILTGNYDAIVGNIYNNYHICENFLNMLFDGDYKFVVITESDWEKYRDEYIKNIKAGKKYQLMELENMSIDTSMMDKEPTVVDKLFELVGEDIIEFK
ncbi:MAG: DNA polymerase III subunit gamma/tau [Bacilli bacterium]|nr:DNA polymerase III subunit gamma/tau [Bacilli bacterium]